MIDDLFYLFLGAQASPGSLLSVPLLSFGENFKLILAWLKGQGFFKFFFFPFQICSDSSGVV